MEGLPWCLQKAELFLFVSGLPTPSLNQFSVSQTAAECGRPITIEVPSLPLDNDPELEQEVLAALSLLISPPPVFAAVFQ